MITVTSDNRRVQFTRTDKKEVLVFYVDFRQWVRYPRGVDSPGHSFQPTAELKAVGESLSDARCWPLRWK